MQIIEIKNFLKEHKITYEELSKLSNIPIGTLKSIFSGRTPNPRVDTIQAIERALGINEKNPIAERPLSDISENFIREYSAFFSDETFQNYVKLYKIMDMRQRIFVLGMIVGWLKDQGINVKNI